MGKSDIAHGDPKKEKFHKNKDGKKNRKEKRSDPEDLEDLKLEDVLALDGDEEDYKMLLDMDRNSGDSEEFNVTEKSHVRMPDSELESFMATLGLNKVAAYSDEEEEEEEEKIPTLVQVTKEDKKKEKASDSDKVTEVETVEEEKTNEKEKKEKAAKRGAKMYGKLEAYKLAKYNAPPKDRKGLMLPDKSLWYEIEVDAIPDSDRLPLAPNEVAIMQSYGQQVLEADSAKYIEQYERENTGDVKWMQKVAESGTLDDKMAAQVLFLQESAIHRSDALEKLVGFACSKGKREALMAIDHLREVLLDNLLPKSRKLRFFNQQPLSNEAVTDKHLALWCYEDTLKRQFMLYISALETHSHDNEQGVKGKTLKIMYEFLLEKPEQEKNILTLLVNKMGDPDRQVASKVVYLLAQLVAVHPNMKIPVVREVEQIIYRPNIKARAQYYAVCYLNQLVLSQRERSLATVLVDLYFNLFAHFTGKGEMASKMLSALLTGVNRAFPFADIDDEVYNKHVDLLFKTVHVGTLSTGIQALMLLFQVMHSRKTVSDRFYRALYNKINDVHSVHNLNSASFLNVIYKALSVDASIPRVQAFIKRLLQLCTGQQPPFVCAVLFLISELNKAKPGLLSVTMGPIDDDEEEKFVDLDVDEEGNVVGPVNDDVAEKKDAGVAAKKGQDGWVAAYGSYNPVKLDPLFAGANTSCAWELSMLARHFHPSVASFAATLSKGQAINYIGDPLQDFTFMRFVDKFAYKNAKKLPSLKGAAIMQRPLPLPAVDVHSKEFMELASKQVAPEDLFFYNYFTEKKNRTDAMPKKDKKNKKEDGDLDEMGDDDLQKILAGDEDMSDEEAVDMDNDEIEGLEGDSDEEGIEEEEGVEVEGSEEEVESDEGEFSYDKLQSNIEQEGEGEDEDEEEDPMDKVDWDAVAMASSEEEEEEEEEEEIKPKKGKKGKKRQVDSDSDDDDE
eukprot:Ihof_evm1s195 gene=Ihof_evmTU1s195